MDAQDDVADCFEYSKCNLNAKIYRSNVIDISLKALLLFLYIQSFVIFYVLIGLIMLNFMIQVLNMDKGQKLCKNEQKRH